MPVQRIAPVIKAVTGGKIIDVVYKERFMILRVTVQFLIKQRDKVRASAVIINIAVAEQPPRGAVKIILNYGAVKPFGKLVPHNRKVVKCVFKHYFNIFGCT